MNSDLESKCDTKSKSKKPRFAQPPTLTLPKTHLDLSIPYKLGKTKEKKFNF
jgi:hypothetical protein